MYKLPIKRSKVLSILEVAKVTEEVEALEDPDTKNSFDGLRRTIEKAQRGIPANRMTLLEEIKSLDEKERISLLLIVEAGRGTVTEITDEGIDYYFETAGVEPPFIPGHLFSLLDLPQYIEKGLNILDERVQ